MAALDSTPQDLQDTPLSTCIEPLPLNTDLVKVGERQKSVPSPPTYGN